MDETTDNSTKMQVVISLRYTNNSGTPLEHIVAVLEASSSTGEALPNKVGLLETMEQLGFRTNQLVGQAVGWCSNFGGDIMRSSQSNKSHVSTGTVHVVLVVIVIVIVIVNSKSLKRHSKAKRRAPAYSRALRQIR